MDMIQFQMFRIIYKKNIRMISKFFASKFRLQQIFSTMGKKLTEQTVQKVEEPKVHKKSKANRFDDVLEQATPLNKKNWATDAVVYIGHLPHGFLEEQMKEYFSQYGEVLAVKLARARKTARSKGYAFIQFKYPEVADIVADTMNGYLLLGKVLTSHVLSTNLKNPFSYPSSREYKFINWKRIFIRQKNKEKTEQQLHKEVSGLLRNEKAKKEKLTQIGYDYPGFEAFLTA